jgi:ribonuclease PH
MNIAMLGSGGFIELQGTAEGAPFTREELSVMIDLAARGISRLHGLQRVLMQEPGRLEAQSEG